VTEVNEIARGMNYRRTVDNHPEFIMAQEWDKFLASARGPNGNPDSLDYMLHMGDQHGHIPRCSDRDRLVANSIIQWLGSPVGNAFVRDALEKIDNEKK